MHEVSLASGRDGAAGAGYREILPPLRRTIFLYENPIKAVPNVCDSLALKYDIPGYSYTFQYFGVAYNIKIQT